MVCVLTLPQQFLPLIDPLFPPHPQNRHLLPVLEGAQIQPHTETRQYIRCRIHLASVSVELAGFPSNSFFGCVHCFFSEGFQIMFRILPKNRIEHFYYPGELVSFIRLKRPNTIGYGSCTSKMGLKNQLCRA